MNYPEKLNFWAAFRIPVGQIFHSDQIIDAIAALGRLDVLIAGSGPAGALVTKQLCEKGYNVLVLEAGNRLPDTDAKQYFEFNENGQKSNVNFGLSWQLGGATNLWSGRCAPLEPADINKFNGWPFEFEDLSDCYSRATEILGLGKLAMIESLPGLLEGLDLWERVGTNKNLSIKKFQWNKPCFNSGKLLTALTDKYENMNIFLDSRLLKLAQIGSNSRVTAADIGIGGGKKISLISRHYVLATGGIETPRILLNSKDRQKNGLGNSSDVVGRYFSTHPKGNVATLHLRKPVTVRSPMFIDSRIGQCNLRYGLGRNLIPTSHQKKLNHYVQFSPRYENFGMALLEHLQLSAALVNGSGKHTLFRGWGLSKVRVSAEMAMIMVGRILYNIFGKIGILQRKTSMLTVRGYFDQYPDPDNRVTLSTKTDRFDMPKAQIDWLWHEKDAISVKEFLGELKQIFADAGIGNLKIDLPEDYKDWKLTGIHSHFMGATRMGNNPRSSVTDSFGKLHDCNNVSIAGASLFSSYGYANPVLTICALSLRVAGGIELLLKPESNN